MSITSAWSRVEYDVIETLTSRVRLLSLAQAHEVWSDESCSVSTIDRTISRLIKSGLIVGDVWKCPPIAVGRSPLIRWQMGDAAPDMGDVHSQIVDRWSGDGQQLPVVAATRKAARLFGSSGGEFPPEHHRKHDLLLSAVYVRYCQSKQTESTDWIGEDSLPLAEKGVKNPDAFVTDAEGRVLYVVESVGRYSVKQLLTFHSYCQLRDLPYELW